MSDLIGVLEPQTLNIVGVIESKEINIIGEINGSGTAGETGLQGIQGIKGDTGADSVIPGPQGIQGTIGNTGLQGLQGIQGIQGETGLTGASGAGTGDMLVSVYDSNADGTVNDSDKLGGQLPSSYAPNIPVTISENGLMIATDKVKLNAITGTNTGDQSIPTTLPASSASSLVITTGLGFTPATAAQGTLATNALPKTGGTLTGILTAQANTSYTVAQLHNVILSTSDAVIGSMGNGALWVKYV